MCRQHRGWDEGREAGKASLTSCGEGRDGKLVGVSDSALPVFNYNDLTEFYKH